ncbi:TolC family protein [Phocaeicola abscessus]|uniref:TolC family protein n=1 Tax=Phocaeicola abscessus TaxID=555313 RepID=UPI0028EFF15B|nr:TolC family protein [Phocaeicola abscessus]
MRKSIYIIICMLPMLAQAQSLTLEECKQMAHDNYPAVKQYDLIELSRDYTLENAQKAWLPQISVSANAMAFTNVLGASPAMRQMGLNMKNWMASGSVVVSQNLYDGGQIKSQKEVASAEANVRNQQLRVSLYELNQRVEQLYFGVLMLDERLKQTLLLQSDLDIARKGIESMMRGGVANQSDWDAVRVEEVKARQAFDAQQASRTAYLKMLGIFVGRQLGEKTLLAIPPVKDAQRENTRPELQYYTAQGRLIEAQRRLLNTRLMPTLKVFGMGTYHTKVTDMMKNGLLAGGLTLNWNIGSLYTRRNDIRLLEAQSRQIDSQRETFLFNNSLQEENGSGNIDILRRQIEQDEEIVRLRENIRSKSESKVRLGTESVNEMLRDINAVAQARQQKALHEIELLRELYALNTIKGE